MDLSQLTASLGSELDGRQTPVGKQNVFILTKASKTWNLFENKKKPSLQEGTFVFGGIPKTILFPICSLKCRFSVHTTNFKASITIIEA